MEENIQENIQENIEEVVQENVQPKIKYVKFKNNTQEAIGVKVALTPDKEYKLISAKIVTQTYSTPACSNVLEYVIIDDNDEKNMFPSFMFYGTK